MGAWNIVARALDRVFFGLVDFIVFIIDHIKPGWSIKNKTKIDEWKLMFYAFDRSPLGVFGLFLIIIFIFLGLFGPALAPYKYNEYPVQYLGDLKNIPPGAHGFILGTEYYGRDLFSMLLYGARMSLILTILTITISAPIGITLGLISGYYGGKIDELIMRITDIFYAFPGLVLAIALAAVLPDRLRDLVLANKWLKGLLLFLFAGSERDAGNIAPFLSIILALAVVGWPGYTRLVRGMVLSVKENVYVEAARALGVSNFAIMRKHILPNVASLIIVILTFDLGSIVMYGAALSFLGVGAQDPFTDWGKLVQTGSRYFPNYYWLVLYPGLTLFIVGLGWTFFGDAIRDVLDPQTRRRIEFGVKEKVGVWDIVSSLSTLGLFATAIWTGFDAWDPMVPLALFAYIGLSAILFKLIEYLMKSFGPEYRYLALLGLIPMMFAVTRVHLIGGVISTIFLALMLIPGLVRGGVVE